MFIGAEIFVEPGQTQAEIYHWFKIMSDHGMRLTRIRMFENYMRKGDNWDFSLFEIAFLAAEKYDIKIYANLFPETEFSDVGGFKFPKSEENFRSIANYIKHVVEHFSTFKSLYGWVPINEPGAGELPTDVFTTQKYQQWQANKPVASYNSNGFTTFELAEQRFLLHYNTWFLKWLTDEIRKYDANSPIHVNNHDIFKNAAEYEFPAWREFLSSLGGSAHASWHFDYFDRSQFGVAMSANAEMLRSGAGPIPWFMTELQGGNNTYSGKRPLCPTAEEIAQWLWINIGSGSEGGMFWCLNPRRSGFEAGEWAMLDLLDQPTDRLVMASRIAETVTLKASFFDDFKVVDSGISVIYTRESLWIEQALQIKGVELEGRMVGGVMKSALSYFEALSEMGVHAAFNEIGEYDFTQGDYSGKTILLSHQISIPSKYWPALNGFVEKGGKLIVDGLTGYYDENALCVMGANFPFKSSFGAVVKEFKFKGSLFDLPLIDGKYLLQAHLWKGLLEVDTAISIADSSNTSDEREILACRNFFGRGEVVWIPSMMGIASRIERNYAGLSEFLRNELGVSISHLPLNFQNHHPGMLLKLIKNGNSYLSIFVNKSGESQHIPIFINDLVFKEVIFGSCLTNPSIDNILHIHQEETLVVEWTMKA